MTCRTEQQAHSRSFAAFNPGRFPFNLIPRSTRLYDCAYGFPATVALYHGSVHCV